MNNEMQVVRENHIQTAADIRANVNRIQEVMKSVMKGPSKENPEGVHYGVIPGTNKPTLYKPGAEVLATTFRLAPEYLITDLSGPDFVKYRVTARLVHQTTRIVMGDGVGSCSSLEEKYKWRRPVCDKEYDMTPDNMRRIKFAKYNNRIYENKQIRTEPADIDNTVLKMACKRAFVAAVLNVTAASDIFTQDIEDLPEELRNVDDDRPAAPAQTARAAKSTYTDQKFKELLPQWQKLVNDNKKTAEQIIAMVSSKVELTDGQKAAIRNLENIKPKPETKSEQSTDEWLGEFEGENQQ